jgi:hypothetical protein
MRLVFNVGRASRNSGGEDSHGSSRETHLECFGESIGQIDRTEDDGLRRKEY